jgi:hypothetical protein
VPLEEAKPTSQSGVMGTDTRIFSPEIDRGDFYRGRRRGLQSSG